MYRTYNAGPQAIGMGITACNAATNIFVLVLSALGPGFARFILSLIMFPIAVAFWIACAVIGVVVGATLLSLAYTLILLIENAGAIWWGIKQGLWAMLMFAGVLIAAAVVSLMVPRFL